ncbi:hypothetical protein [Nocardia wallacei]|uniref:hypothetical protein n=1 Tax=Nocardia wallacei TaxID=480035 RepID=UPI002454D773|nr:hypothetical protein [Nocardia wallacei]
MKSYRSFAMRLPQQPPIDPIPMAVGDHVRLDGKPRRWTVQAVSEHFAALVQQAPFEARGTLQYTVIDWRNGIRGPCDLIGQGYGDGSYSRQECERMLSEFEFDPETDPAMIEALARGEASWTPSHHHLEVSHRNRVPLGSIQVMSEARH